MNPTAGSFIVNPRLMRHFWNLNMPFPEQGSLNLIYTTFVKGHFCNFKSNVLEEALKVSKLALTVHEMVQATFKKTAQNFHYEFNIRHLTGIFTGILQAKAEKFITPEKVCKLWCHETERI